MNKILFLEWNSYGKESLLHTFKEMGYEITLFSVEDKAASGDGSGVGFSEEEQKQTEGIATTLLSGGFDFVFSSNFYPPAAIACKACRIPYISWIYDSPYVRVYSNTALFETNYIFHFDEEECLRLQAAGVPHVFYMPLGAPVDIYDKFDPEKLSASERDRFSSDISFVGSLYTEKKQRLYDRLDNLPDYERGYFEAVVEAQKRVYGYNFLEKTITPELVEKLQEVAPFMGNPNGFETFPWLYANYFLARKVTAKERADVAEILRDEFADDHIVKIFSNGNTDEINKNGNGRGIIFPGGVDYEKECPYVFKLSKINLNISLKSIQTGIPLRAMDIMGCGGFLMTNFQSDFLKHFEPDVDFVYYESMEDLKYKLHYYLEHDDERIQIAKNGYDKVRESVTMRQCLEAMIRLTMT